MIDIQMVKNKVDAILTDLTQLKEFESYSFDQVAKDYRTHKVVSGFSRSWLMRRLISTSI